MDNKILPNVTELQIRLNELNNELIQSLTRRNENLNNLVKTQNRIIELLEEQLNREVKKNIKENI